MLIQHELWEYNEHKREATPYKNNVSMKMETQHMKTEVALQSPTKWSIATFGVDCRTPME